MAIEKENLKNTGDIIAYLNTQRGDISPEDINTLYDIMIGIKPTPPQDLASFLDACANASVFYKVDDHTGTTTGIYEDIFGRYPDFVIEIARDGYGCDIPEDIVDPGEVFDAIFFGYYANDIYRLLSEAVRAAEGIKSDDNDDD